MGAAILAPPASAESTHGIAMYGAPELPENFEALPYVNPDAPKGGRVTFAEFGSFDSLNPFVLKGAAPWALSSHMFESMLARSYAEPFTLYANLAEAVEVPADRSGVTFTLNPAARFSDGNPVTVEDVIWSFETLAAEGHPRYDAAWSQVASIEPVGERGIRIAFTEPNRELPLILGLRPVLKKAQFEGRTLDAEPLEPLIGSGPYVVGEMEAGRSITFRRDPDWWGEGRPINRGLNNFEEVRYDYYRSSDAIWQAVTAGAVDMQSDSDPVRWLEGYGFAAAEDGRLSRTEIAHGRPSGMYGFVFNTRRAPLDDIRVRRALGLAFDWAWINQRLYGGGYERITSYFGGSPLSWNAPEETGAGVGALASVAADAAAGAPAALAVESRAATAKSTASAPEPRSRRAPGGDEIGWPVSDGSGRDRRLLREAARLLEDAGMPVQNGARLGPDRQPMVLGVLVGSTEHETLAGLWADTLRPLGIELDIRRVDAAQFAQRRRDYDYDITVHRWVMSLSPGTEQRYYFGSDGRETPGTRNYMGVADPAVDAAIEGLLVAEDAEAFRGAARRLDRLLTEGLYVVPFGVLPNDRIVHDADLRHPDWQDGQRSLYGWFGWWSGPGVWWREETE
ncbi:MAG: extracellular solute-binding protein [Pseudomonadota bacterium]